MTRLERWTDEQPSTNGFALLLTNDARLWEAPPTTNTGDAAFRLHEGRTLTGELAWGDDEHPYEADRRTLRGTYRTTWSDFSRPDAGVGGTLRWLGWTITSRAPGAV